MSGRFAHQTTASKGLVVVFIDTDVLSIFAKIQRLSLLFTVFNEDSLNISAAVENELQTGIAKGFDFAQHIMALHSQGRIITYHPTAVDQQFTEALPWTLGSGERESMAICKRLSAIFVSNERRVKHHCRENRIDCVNLSEILRASWERGILMQPDVRKVITEIETKDNLKFRTTDPIFK